MMIPRISCGRLNIGLRRTALTSVRGARRTLHSVADLKNIDLSQGIPGLYTAQGLAAAWTDVQTHAVSELNSAIQSRSSEAGNTELENLPALNLIALSKAFPTFDSRIAFYAGQVYNNEFQMAGLLSESKGPNSFNKSDPQSRNDDVKRVTYADFRNAPIDISTTVEYNSVAKSLESDEESILLRMIHRQFESEVSFRELFLTQAASTFSSGYTWLVHNNQDQKLYLMNTYGWGVPPLFSTSELNAIRNMKKDNSVPSGGSIANERLDSVIPLLNVSVWQHAYLHDYGVFGKRKYLENFWNSINWKHVEQRYTAMLDKPDNTISY